MNLDDIDRLPATRPDDARLDKLHRITDVPRPHERYPFFFYHLVREREPALCLEIGCLRAITSAYMCAAASEYGGHVVAIDLGEEHVPRHVLPALFYNFHYIVGDSRSIKVERQVQGLVEQYGPIGVVWQDSSHLYEQSCQEWDLYRPMLDKKAVWACDDLRIWIREDAEATGGLWHYWIERPGREKKIYADGHPFRYGADMGVIVI